ncbi:very-long-chain 3-oxoacyl-CoA synthase [Malassezia yamatoensis]|uniref:Elongation of fatty acids protein n=1 Tax=Malassezia yamatoensis TaxID=253288 RepID=A0AAJ5YSL3_9BASI|nr:very-long-chain 3-oxoacyl-CoA synthase [Malassezia yamatoensis]
MSLYQTLKEYVPESVQRFTTPMQLWQPGVTPISTTTSVVSMSVLYLVVILGGQELMRNRAPIPSRYLKVPFFIHNVLLSVGSGLLLALILEEVLPFAWAHGVHDSICRPEVTTKRMMMFYIINYYFKYWELLDTVFLVLKKKNLLFLHVYHHMATAALCWSQIVGRTSLAWSIISLNLAVHVVMYAYYALTSIGIRCPWKKVITVMQITQFVLDLMICFWGIYNFYVSTQYSKWLPYYRYCHGSPFAAWTGIGVLTSYLFLFLVFFRKTYTKPKTSSAKKAN